MSAGCTGKCGQPGCVWHVQAQVCEQQQLEHCLVSICATVCCCEYYPGGYCLVVAFVGLKISEKSLRMGAENSKNRSSYASFIVRHS